MGKPNKEKSVKKIISNVVFGIFMAFFGLIIAFSIIDKTVGFSISGHHILWVKTNSMEDTIPAQSYILVEDVKAEDVKEGDIISFISDDPSLNGMLNTHRVISINADGTFTTKGDHYFGQDAYLVRPENVKYIYEKNLPFISIFGRLFTTPVGYGLTVLCVIGLGAVWFTIDYKERKEENKKELMDEMVKKEVERLEEEAKTKNITK